MAVKKVTSEVSATKPVPQDGLVTDAKMNVDSVSNSMLVTMLMEIVPKGVSKVSKEIYAKRLVVMANSEKIAHSNVQETA